MINNNLGNSNNRAKVVRQEQLAEKIVIVDGQPGCGKTMLSPIIASMERVELLSYAFEIEFICRLFHLKKIESDAATALVRMLIDHKLYQTMMGRDTNFRYSDLSSVFQDSNPWRYFKRIFQKGDMEVPDRIKNERPILNITTHDLLSRSEPIISGLSEIALLVEVVRHPLYMVRQQQLNMERLVDNARDIDVNIEYKGKQLPYFAHGWEEQFLQANSMERAIYCIEKKTIETNEKRKIWKEKNQLSILTIPFEKFVIDPWPFIKEIEEKLVTKVGRRTNKIMKKQNVPRKVLSDAPSFEIYERCGWEPPTEDSEENELTKRRRLVAKNSSKRALEVMDKLSQEYFQDYLS
tara:strand:+ start:3560 stop:4612 length:1053 start_codon:yes stop_codon:yes gene_type:complete